MKNLSLKGMEKKSEYGGFGYLGHEDRTEKTDATLLKAALHLKLSQKDLFLWCNSVSGRWFMNQGPKTKARFIKCIPRDLRELHEELIPQRSKNHIALNKLFAKRGAK